MNGDTPVSGYVDAHCHIDLFPNPGAIVSEAERSGIHTIAVTNVPSVFSHTQKLCQGTTHVHAALGLHPELIRTHGKQIEQFLSLLPSTRFVGEVGLDYVTTDRDERKTQADIFGKILEGCARLGDRILTIHSRRSAADVISLVGDRFPGKTILHWFSGTTKELQKAISFGFWFSVNPAMLRSKNGRAVIAAIPRDRLLTETDGPFVEIGSRPATPVDVRDVVSGVAEIWACSGEEARRIIAQNCDRLRLPGTRA
jgi:TatD DNase family protein